MSLTKAHNRMIDGAHANVKDFGALGDGVANDAAAFSAAITKVGSGGTIFVPQGTYKLNTDVNATSVNVIANGATFTGSGIFSTNSILEMDATDGVSIKDLNSYIDANGILTPIQDAVASYRPEYPDKFFPTAAHIELLRLSPAVTSFERTSDGNPDHMNETFYREMLREMFSVGVNKVILTYLEYQGFWFYQPTFAYPYDYDTSRDGQFWSDWLTGYPNVLSFNPVTVTYEEAEKANAKVFVGLGRNGDTPLMFDLYSVNILGNPDPNRYGLSLAARTSNAVNRTQQVAEDIYNQYNHYQSFGGFYISHEPSHLGSANNYLTPATTTSGTSPNLRSYGKPIIVASADTVDLAVTSTFANAVIASGCDIFSPQDATGPGYDFDTDTYEYVPSSSIEDLNSYYEKWNNAISIVNGKANLNSRHVQLWANTEIWQMGFVQSAVLTLSATSGASVTATAAAPAFTAADVGKYITSKDGGNAKITAFTSSTVVTIDTTVAADALHAAGAAFASTTQATLTWSINTGYSNDYPADFNRVQSQLYEEWPHIEASSIYTWFGFADSGTKSLRLSQSNSGLTDYRTRAINFYNSYKSFYNRQVSKYQHTLTSVILQNRFFSRGSAAAAATLTDDFATLYPRHDGSKVTYLCIIRGTLASGTSTLNLNLRVNSTVVKTVTTQAISNATGGSYVLAYTENPKGLSRPLGISFSSSSANFTLDGVEIIAIEHL